MPEVLLCINCGYQGESKKIARGSCLIEIILWLFLIIPGLVYTAWRLTSKFKVCPKCGAEKLIPLTSPVAQKFLDK